VALYYRNHGENELEDDVEEEDETPYWRSDIPHDEDLI